MYSIVPTIMPSPVTLRERRARALAQRGDEAKVAELRRTVRRQPDVGRLEVPVNHAAPVRMVQCGAHVRRDARGALDGQPPARCLREQINGRAAIEILLDDVRRAQLLAGIVDRDHVLMPGKPTHRPGLATNPICASGVRRLAADERKGDLPVQHHVAGEVHPLVRPSAEEPFDAIAPADERIR